MAASPLPDPKVSEKRALRPSVGLRLVATDGRAIGKPGICRECGNHFLAKRTTREFCSAACRAAHNNRRAIRGALIYDLLMTWRFDRGDGKDSAARDLMGRAAAAFKAEDDRDRDSRQSWDDLCKWRERNPRIAAKVVGISITGERRR